MKNYKVIFFVRGHFQTFNDLFSFLSCVDIFKHSQSILIYVLAMFPLSSIRTMYDPYVTALTETCNSFNIYALKQTYQSNYKFIPTKNKWWMCNLQRHVINDDSWRMSSPRLSPSSAESTSPYLLRRFR